MGVLIDIWDSIAQLGSPLYNGIKAWWDGADSPEDYYNQVAGDYSPAIGFDGILGSLGNIPGTNLPWTLALIACVGLLAVYLIFFRRTTGGGTITNLYFTEGGHRK